jgi:lipopolysaccharide/colanic/teichoic acid biosynthesis glycosyltransferase
MNSVAEVVREAPEMSISTEYSLPGFASGEWEASASPSLPALSDWTGLDARRALNVIVAAVALVLCAPLMLLIAALVKLSSPGPVIYKQTRVGLDRRNGEDDHLWRGRRRIDYGGRLFTMYKFRTMRAEPGQTLQIWARPDDSRVTMVGRVLRRYRLDELPQLLNVIKGDMNIVGPRPEQPKIFMGLREQVDGYAQRQRVLPGITGWAQINQSYDRCVEDVRQKVKYDLEYIGRQSAHRDLAILLRTVPVVLFKRGGW